MSLPVHDIDSLNTLGTAVLNSTGEVVKATGDLDGDSETVARLFRILADSGTILKGEETGEALRRITVSFSEFQYIIAVSQDHAYIVKSKVEKN